jgi:hypothetical protein
VEVGALLDRRQELVLVGRLRRPKIDRLSHEGCWQDLRRADILPDRTSALQPAELGFSPLGLTGFPKTAYIAPAP